MMYKVRSFLSNLTLKTAMNTKLPVLREATKYTLASHNTHVTLLKGQLHYYTHCFIALEQNYTVKK